MVNFDEELLVIYLSILRYIAEVHGFSFNININYDLIPTKVIKSKYIKNNYGTRRLRQIKYKYFSDKALRIWDLCYAFFDREHKITMKVPEDDYLLARDFDHIFEVMIDKLVGGNEKAILPKKLSDQKDDKLVDHIYRYRGLIVKSNLDEEQVYYIGDSKYYKRSKNDTINLGDPSIYKQYTYARNVIQWNMNMFLKLLPKRDVYDDQPQLRDDLTEGYNPIPNFFISAHIPDKKHSGEDKFLSFENDALHNEQNINLNRQFENRLFDRDTLLLCYYDVNFLFIVSLYGRDNKRRQEEWREKVRKEFRKSIQDTLNKLYDFYILQPREGKNCHDFIKENFHKLNGKIYRPQKEGNYLILALMKKEAEKAGVKFGEYTAGEIEKNEELKHDLERYFHVSKEKPLEDDLIIEDIPNVGTLEEGDYESGGKGPYLLSTVDPYVNANITEIAEGKATCFVSGYNALLSGIDFSRIKYLAAVIDHIVAGYYKVESRDVFNAAEILEEAKKTGSKHYKGYDKPYRVKFVLGDYTPLKAPFTYGIDRNAAKGVEMPAKVFREYCMKGVQTTHE